MFIFCAQNVINKCTIIVLTVSPVEAKTWCICATLVYYILKSNDICK